MMATTHDESNPHDGGLGAGGKFRKWPFRRTTQTMPYDRPPTAIRNPSGGAGRNGWLSKLVDLAQRLITSSALRLFASVFRKRLRAPPPHPPQAPEPGSRTLKKINDLGAAADLRVGINYILKEFLLDLSYFGESNMGSERGERGSSSSSRKGKKSNSDKPKQPQRGLAVAQLEKVRLHGQMGCNYHPSLHGPYPAANFNQLTLQIWLGEYDQSPNIRCGDSQPRTTAIWNPSSGTLDTQHFAQPNMTRQHPNLHVEEHRSQHQGVARLGGLQFPVGRTWFLKAGKYPEHVRVSVPVYLAAVLEYPAAAEACSIVEGLEGLKISVPPGCMMKLSTAIWNAILFIGIGVLSSADASGGGGSFPSTLRKHLQLQGKAMRS
ncbi:hypothetical protein COLO4_17464 [Corchorus olitorius]|uniref:Uncharacterized protein n=1 Tax=Corchorus olitorius TaxID=93759 RepID=A0A1R3JCJ2_9ROSI|nr:hypothetical protein COLO4_17464 [Corchorus olitorius]